MPPSRSRLFLLWLERARPNEAPGKIEAAIRSGLASARWPGRLELIRHDPLTVIDVGHTPDGIRQSLASLKAIYGAQGWLLVPASPRTRRPPRSSARWRRPSTPSSAPAAHHKGADAEDIAAAAREANPAAAVHLAATIEDAVGLSQRLAASQGRRIYVAGGLFLAIEYATIARGGGARDLNFF